jgi:beta-glucosidase-like glycosyl hydrolase
MKKRSNYTNLFIVILFVAAVLLGYNYFARPFLRNFPQQDSQNPADEQVSEEEKTYIEEKLTLLDSLSDEQKVAQLIAYPLVVGDQAGVGLSEESTPSSSLTATTSADIRELSPGIITLFGDEIPRDAAATQAQEINNIFVNEPIGPLLAVDHEGGTVQRLAGAGFSKLPAWREMCAQNEQERRELLEESAQELSQLGVSIVFAPVLDINSSVLSSRSCANYDQLFNAAGDFIEIFGNYQVMSVIKHFPGLGNTTKDLHFNEESIALSEGDSKIFSEILSTYPNIGVMNSHVKLNELLDGSPCSLSAACLSAFPHEFPLALLFTDALDMGALDSYGESLVDEFEFATLSLQEVADNAEAAKLTALSYQAVMAGNDVLVFGRGVDSAQLAIVRDELAAKMKQDEELAERVELSVSKMLAVKNINPNKELSEAK